MAGEIDALAHIRMHGRALCYILYIICILHYIALFTIA